MITAKKDFVELIFTGRVNGDVFDSNDPEEIKKLDSKTPPRKTLVAIGEKMVISGLDHALEGKEIGKNYSVHVPYKEGFGERKANLVKTISLHVFAHQNINPQAGMTLFLDNMVANIRAVSGARVITDFNNPLAGKDLDYVFTITRKVEDMKEKVELLAEWFLQQKPEVEVKDKLILKCEKIHPLLANMLEKKVKDLLGKDIEWVFVEPVAPKADATGSTTQ